MIARCFASLLFCLLVLETAAQLNTYASIKDSILRAPKMQYRLQKDSVEHARWYYFRKNNVRMRIEEEDNESYLDNDTMYLNTWGAIEMETMRHSEIFLRKLIYRYNEFGDVTKIRTEYYVRNVLNNIIVDTYSYNVLPGALREVLILHSRRDSSFWNGKFYQVDSSSIAFEYNEYFVCTTQVETDTHGECSEKYRTSIKSSMLVYDKDGKLVQKSSYSGGSCRSSSTETYDWIYDADGRISEVTRKEDGRNAEWISYTWTRDGQVATYFSSQANTQSTYSSKHTYLRNGLEHTNEGEFDQEKFTLRFTYVYYTETKKSKR